MLLKGTQKIYHDSGIQVVTVFKQGANVGCYCNPASLLICHLHKPKPRRSFQIINGQKVNIDSGEIIDVDLSSIRRSKNAVLDYALSNKFDYFLTLTFNPDLIDVTNHDLVKIHFSKWLNKFRYHNPDSKYILVPELHKSGALHFHGLFSNIQSELGAAINPHTGKKIVQKGRQVYNLKIYDVGYSTVIKKDNSPKTAYYITKYIKKEMIDNHVLNRKRYWVSRGLKKPLKIQLTHGDLFDLEAHKKQIVGIYETDFYTKYTLNLTNMTAPFMLRQQELKLNEETSYGGSTRN